MVYVFYRIEALVYEEGEDATLVDIGLCQKEKIDHDMVSYTEMNHIVRLVVE